MVPSIQGGPVRVSISFKYSLLVLLSIAATSSLISWFVLDLMVSEVQSQLVLRGTSIARQLGTSLAPLLLSNDEAKVRAALLNALKEEGVIGGTIVDADGLVVADRENAPIGNPPAEPLLSLFRECLGQVTDSTRLIFLSPSEYSKVRLGCVAIELSRSALEQAIRRTTEKVLTATLMIALAVILLSFLTLRRTLRPLARVIEGTQRIAAGDFTFRLSQSSRDEIGDLARAFNDMAGRTELFFRYVDKSIAERLIADESLARPGGQLKQASVLFGDMRDYTGLSNRRSPAEVVWILNTYFELFFEVVHHFRGVVDKTMGDAIMAFFEPTQTNDTSNARRATLSAIAMRGVVHVMEGTIVEATRREIPVLIEPRLFGFGVATGRLIIGNIGSARHMDYTLCGPAVNLASRLQQDTIHGEVIIDRFTNIDVESLIATHELPMVLPKGFAPTHEVTPYQVIGLSEKESTPLGEVLGDLFNRQFFQEHILDRRTSKTQKQHLDELVSIARNLAGFPPTEYLVR